MKHKVKSAKQMLAALLLVGLLLCSFLPITVFAQNEAGTTEPEAVTQVEDSGSTNPSGETDADNQPADAAQAEDPTSEDAANHNDTADNIEEAAEGANEEPIGIENEAALIEISPLAAAEPLSMQDEVHNLAELQAWLDANPAGGTVTLGSNIEVTGTLGLEQVHIDAGDFGFVVNGILALSGGADITGSGATPLVRIDAGGKLNIIGENSITATGPGGTVVYFAAGGNYMENINARPFLRAEGTDSVAIKSETLLDLKRFTIQAANGGGLIESSEPVRLYLSYVEAEEEIVLPPNITLDTCVVSSNISGGTVISRKITEVKPPSPFLLCRGEEAPGFYNEDVRCSVTLAVEGASDEYEQVYIRFDDRGIDYDTPGEYLLPGTLLPPHDDFDIVPQDKPLAAALTIYDSGIPYFSGYVIRRGVLVVSYEYRGDFEALTLHRSDDGGESWYVYWQPGDEESDKFQIDHDDYSLDLYFLDLDELAAPALLVFEVGEGVGSDILLVEAGAVENIGHGGDRDSGDRILLPWEFFTGNPGEDDEENGGPEGGTNPPPDTNDGTGGSNPPPNTGNGTGSTNPPPNTEGETDNKGSGDSGGNDNAPSNLAEDGTPATQPEAESAVQLPPGSGEAVMPVAANAEAPLPAGTAPFGAPGNMIAAAAADASVPAPTSGETDPPPAEYEDETTIAISGKRLEALMSVNPQMVPFAREDIQVWIPTGLLSGMSLADSDIFMVNIERPTQTSVSVLFYMNGQALNEPFAEPFLVGIPWPETNGEIICTDSSGKEIPFEYDRQSGLLILTLYECGTYTIEAEPGEIGIAVSSADTHISGNPAEVVPELLSEQTPASSPFFPLLAAGTVGVGGAGGLAYAFRKRRVKRV